MKAKHLLILTPILVAGITSGYAFAGGEPKMVKKAVVALQTDGDELVETDVSHLEIGDSEIFETAGGKEVEVLRTADGLEILIDGETLALPQMHQSGQSGDVDVRVIKKHMEIDCAGECEDHDIMVFKHGHKIDVNTEVGEDFDWVEADGKKVIIIETDEEIVN